MCDWILFKVFIPYFIGDYLIDNLIDLNDNWYAILDT